MRRRTNYTRPLTLLAVLALVVAACSTPGSSETTTTQTQEAPDTGEPITLAVAADAGEEATLEIAKAAFEASHPNVTINVSLKGFDDHVSTINLVLAGDDAPDIAQGNQGYGVDAALVAAGLILSLDDYAAQYGWTDRFSAGSLAEFRWSEDGTEFGVGPLWGISPVSEDIGVYYNKEKLAELGLDVPETFADFEAALGAASGAGELAIQLGNADQWPGIHVWSLVEGVFEDAANTRAWIFGTDGATFETAGRLAAAEKLQEWVDAGYFGTDYNGVGYDDATAKFAAGEGLFFPVGTWQTNTLTENMGDAAGYMAMPAAAGGTLVGGGSLGLGWHISSKTAHADLAGEFIALLVSAEFTSDLVSVNRVPAQSTSAVPETALLKEVVAGVSLVLADDGQTFYHDWATPTMYDAIAPEIQKLLAGATTPADFLAAVQADWSAFLEG
jgi:raffinose/stachyose/melibiose transport system substrate-binding protein